MRRFPVIFLQTVLVALWTVAVLAEVPQLINFQGVLRDGSGNPVANGSYSVVFTIYDAPAGGNVKWTETQSVTTTDGLFSVLLGGVSPVLDSVFNDSSRYLGVKVGADPEMTPRTALVSVPYSHRTSTVDGASGGTITSKVSIGQGHINTGTDAFVAGDNNKARGAYSVVSGGGGTAFGAADSNAALGDYSVVGGGFRNIAGGVGASVGGGASNAASGDGGTIAGGVTNIASNDYATVGGGEGNTAGGNRATVPGGSSNEATGAFSFAAGHRAKANHDGTFVWGDNALENFASTGENQFLIRASGGVGIDTNSPNSRLHVNGAIATAVTGPVISSITLDESHSVVLCFPDVNFTVNLPPSTGIEGRQYTIKVGQGIFFGAVTIDPAGSETVDGAATYTLSSAYQYVAIVAGSGGWYIVGNN